MKLTACKLVFLLYLMFHLTACGTVLSLVEQDYRVYAGVIKDFQVMQEGGIFAVLAVIDLPLSFVLDTLMLPVTLSQ
ncbi:TPA: YceK/YidQ family lipoprotein [Mannheimia haemolytica]